MKGETPFVLSVGTSSSAAAKRGWLGQIRCDLFGVAAAVGGPRKGLAIRIGERWKTFAGLEAAVQIRNGGDQSSQIAAGNDLDTGGQIRCVREIRTSGSVGADDRQPASERLRQHDPEAILP